MILKKMVHFIIKIKEIITLKISDIEYNQPILSTLQKYNIDRACWTIYNDQTKSYNNVDDYIIKICDLLVFYSKKDQCMKSTRSRFAECNFKIVASRME